MPKVEIDVAAAAQTAGKLILGGASLFGAWITLQKWREGRKEKMKAFFDSLATKEQVERHKQANEQHIEGLKRELERLQASQDDQTKRLDGIQQTLGDLPLRILEAVKGGR